MNSRLRKAFLRFLFITILAAPLLTAGACSIYRNDKCYVPQPRYDSMRQIFMESGSLDMVRRQMDRLQWARCEKNEVLYRLSKEFEVPAE